MTEEEVIEAARNYILYDFRRGVDFISSTLDALSYLSYRSPEEYQFFLISSFNNVPEVCEAMERSLIAKGVIAALKQHPDIREAFVEALESEGEEMQVIACLVNQNLKK